MAMSDKENLQYIENLERAIVEKYGKEAVVNPRSGWSKKKEKEYIKQLKKLTMKDDAKRVKEEKVEINGFLVPKKLLNKEQDRKCPVCDAYSFDGGDNVYMSKFGCCFKCYVKHVEGRKERWKTGWRPNTGDN